MNLTVPYLLKEQIDQYEGHRYLLKYVCYVSAGFSSTSDPCEYTYKVIEE